MAAYQAQVLYEYTAQDDDQLSIKPGEIVKIIDSSQDLNGWALAQKGDKEGYVPAEYVRSIDDNSSPYNEQTRIHFFGNRSLSNLKR